MSSDPDTPVSEPSTATSRPRLVASAGPLAGQEFEFEDELRIGRHSSSDVCIVAAAVSRHHCVIARTDRRFRLRDLDSRSGTLLNGVRVSDEELLEGDRIDIQDSSFLFVIGDESPTAEPHLSSGFELSIDQGLYRRPEALLAGEPGARDDAKQHQLGALLGVATALGSLRDLESLADRLLALVLRAAPAADRVALLAVAASGEERLFVFPPASRSEEPEARLSRTVVDRVMRERVAVLADSVPQAEDLQGAQSLFERAVSTLLCVPLVDLQDRSLGVLYLDSARTEARLGESDLRFMTAFAGLAAAAVANIRQLEWLEAERQRLQGESSESGLLGESAAIRKAHQMIGKISSSSSTVLVLGESGTGKELAARSIHQSSDRSDRPFIAVNCAAIPETLLESELFGHEKGAFTGADRMRAGRVEVADSGTLFLDEIGEMSQALQAKMLRFLEERSFERVGGTKPLHVDVRVIAATHRDLEAEVEKGTFRSDLYYRLNVITLSLPPLRERTGDIALLANHFCGLHAARQGRTVTGFTPRALAALVRYSWPGNVRELSNAVERAVVLGDGDLIELHDLPEALYEVSVDDSDEGEFQEIITRTKRRVVTNAVVATGGNYTDAAKNLGLHPNYLHRLIRNLGIKEEIEKSLD